MAHSDDRIAALEAQVARLAARLEERERSAVRAPDGDARTERPVDRRSLLRGAVAGLVGAAAAPAVFAQPAAAANGDPLILGQPNAATATTSLTATVANAPALRLANDAPLSAENGAHPVLRIAPSIGFVDPALGDAGDLMVSDLTTSTPTEQGGSYLNYAHTGPSTGDEVFWGNVYTSAYASFTEFLRTPVRVLDTRTAAQAPRMADFQTIAINLGESMTPGIARQITPRGLVAHGLGALVNITAVAPLGSGFISVWPTGSRPNASALNYQANVTLANFSIVGLSPNDSFLLFVSKATHVLVDVVGFIVPDVGLVGPFDQSQGGALATRSTTGRQRPRRAPQRLT